MNACTVYALQWLGFGLGHSLLTTPSVKTRLSRITGRGYRLIYNIISVIHLLIVLRYGQAHLSSAHYAVFESNTYSFAMSGISFVGCIIMVWALSLYDLGTFSGLSQLRANRSTPPVQQPLNTQGLLSWVRHPLYLGTLLFLWGRATHDVGLLTAGFASVYLFVGIYFEETKLVREFGDDYRDYKKQVSMLVPIKRLLLIRKEHGHE